MFVLWLFCAEKSIEFKCWSNVSTPHDFLTPDPLGPLQTSDLGVRGLTLLASAQWANGLPLSLPATV